MSALDDMIREIVRAEVRAAIADIKPAHDQQVSVATYAASKSISQPTVRAAIRDGRLPAMRIGTAVRIAARAEIGRPVAAGKSTAATPASRADRILGIGGGRR